ncbi:MAG: ATP-binding protein [Flavobacteriia bacterium]|nr:ATP-binding protein [Flavobacteriia bacterium]
MSNSLWEKLGFRENPYNTKPLNVIKSDVDLLMGRETEQIDFLTAIEADEQGIFVLSGVPGVGKTSFFNVQQYLLESQEAPFGPKVLAARKLCPIQQSDEPKNIAIRSIQSFCKSIEEYCNLTKNTIPAETQKVQNWLYQNKPASFNFGITLFGHGGNIAREVHLPSINETTYETLVELLTVIAYEVKTNLGFVSSFIVLDNMENLHEEDLTECLTTFRDTLFTIPNVWWVLIGQSGLPSLIQSTNPKVFQRLSTSIELNPISVEDLIKAVDIRVQRFHIGQQGSSPISTEIYLKLFDSSNGEIRFVFNYCHDICINLVQTVRKIQSAQKKNLVEQDFERLMGTYLVNNQINDNFSNTCLNNIISVEFNGLYLTRKEKMVLKRIGELKKVKPNHYTEFKDFGIKTLQEFVSKYLVKLHQQYLLQKRQEGKILTYELRGISVFANEYGLLDES